MVFDGHGFVGRAEGVHSVEDGVEADVFFGGEVFVQAGLLEYDAGVFADEAGLFVYVVAGDGDCACGFVEDGGEDGDGGGFAGAVGPEQGEEFTGFDIK